MKTRLVLTLAAAVLGLATLGASDARAQGMLTFSGGNGAPLTLTLNAPVTYVITTAADAYNGPSFNFQGVGNVFHLSNVGTAASGTIAFTINGRAAQTVNTLNSGYGYGDLTAADAYIYGAMPGVAVGDTVVLQAGTLTTSGNFAGAPPASGSYPTFIFDGYGDRLDVVNGVAGPVPEPSTWALLAVGTAAFTLALRQRRSSVA